MKKILYLLILLVLPISVYALEATSELTTIKNNRIEMMNIDEVYVKNFYFTRYTRYGAKKQEAFNVRGVLSNKYPITVDTKITITFYNENKEVIKVLDYDYQLVNEETLFDEVIYNKDDNLDFNDIFYYDLKVDILTDILRYKALKKADYYFSDYSININVNEANIYNIHEKYNVTYNTDKKVEKFIPFRYKYVRDNYTEENRRAIISDFKLNTNYSLSIKKGNRVLSVNDKAESLDLSYQYNVGADNRKGKDEVVYSFDTYPGIVMDGVKMTINLPYDSDNIKVKLLKDKTEVENNFKVEGKKITGSIDELFSDQSKYLLIIELEDGYFKKTSHNIAPITILGFIIPLILLVISLLVYLRIGRNVYKQPYNNFYPYKGFNSLKMGYLLKGRIGENDIASLLFYLANKGYIDIVKVNENYQIVKVKDYDGHNTVESLYMAELFRLKDQLSYEDLKKISRRLRRKIIGKQNDHVNQDIYFIKPFFNYKLLFWLMVILIVNIITYGILFEYTSKGIIWLSLITSSLGYFLSMYIMSSNRDYFEKIIYGIIGLLIVVLPNLFTTFGAVNQSPVYNIIYIFGVFCMVGISIICSKMPNMNRNGLKAVALIRSYRDVLYTMDEKDMKSALSTNGNYYYEMIPYNMVYGTTDNWFNKSENIELKAPMWYKCNRFNIETFKNDIYDIYSDFYVSLKGNKKR